MRVRHLTLAVVALSIGSMMGCSSTPPPDPCTTVPVDDFKELMIVEPTVISDARSSNGTDGPWSFRHVVESLAPSGVDPGEFIRQWFLEWANTTSFNGYALDPPNESRSTAMMQQILCPWMQRTAKNNCNSDCTQCASNPPKLDLAQAPFRLAAIVNRMDLRGQPDLGKSGEARIIFALVDRASDDPDANPLGMTMIFEYGLPETLTTQQWASEWHALGAHAAFDESFKTDLATFTETWIGPGSNPAKQNGTALSQARTNEDVLDWIWQQRQFELGTDGFMHMAGLRNTPPIALNNSSVIADYITQNAAAIEAQTFAMPPALVGGSADINQSFWTFPGIDPTLRKFFSSNTCNGCHTQEVQFKDTAFHVSPFETGAERLSTYVYNPANRATDQLTVREAGLRDALCGN